MPYNPASDFVGLWRAVSGGVEKAEMPGLDFLVAALGRAGILRVVTSQTAPAVNQTTTAWFRPASPSFSTEGVLYLWDANANTYAPATPELFFSSGSNTGGGDGGGDGGGGGSDMAIISPTPPVSPSAGQQWWNGTIMQVWDGGMWKTVGPPQGAAGALETSTTTFAITQTGDITIPSGSWEVVNLTASPLVDTLPGSWDPITHKYTPKKAGNYAFTVRGRTDITSGFSAGVAILKNDDGIFDNSSADTIVGITSATGIAYAWQSASGYAQMNGTTDYVRYFAYVNTTSKKLLDAGSNPVFYALRLS